ncbi:excinuclease ABC subunit C [Jannaschia pagri]|uniref:Excinuclease ABC subunit C n=1 Tax=Jannaschia pagri TaxID=2829797 RepID=A0ABQ4NJC7_9RHOB|nr:MULTISPECIES: GIY-YIG nuclease family protein [unclassified Jannaschia]GIT90707.1 excinuclease ABC subunit C [Jannaschia sp. AI_61]GIT94539.1 excinuclease ABC subunit C [Jannaschia sp. AI_62]
MYYVYILASRPNGALYIGRTTDLGARLAQHRAGLSEHSQRYNINQLVWWEEHGAFAPGLRRERALKRWRRAWKNQLIMAKNPQWEDLSHLWQA